MDHFDLLTTAPWKNWQLIDHSFQIPLIFDIGFKWWILAGRDASTRQREDCVYHQLRLILVHCNFIRHMQRFSYVWTTNGTGVTLTNLKNLPSLSGRRDVMVMGRTFEEHLSNLQEVLNRFWSANLNLNPQKCALLRNKVEFPGYPVSVDRIHTSEDKIMTVRDWPRPQDKHGVS